MFIFNTLVLSLTWPDFFSRAIIEPRVQTPLPAPLGFTYTNSGGIWADHTDELDGRLGILWEVDVGDLFSMLFEIFEPFLF